MSLCVSKMVAKAFVRKVEIYSRRVVGGALCQAPREIHRRLAQAPLQNFRIYRSGQVLTAGSSGQVCARLFKALLQRLGVTGSAHQR